jgi:hypothetical protein
LIDARNFREMHETLGKAWFVKVFKERIENWGAGKGKLSPKAFREIKAKLDL